MSAQIAHTTMERGAYTPPPLSLLRRAVATSEPESKTDQSPLTPRFGHEFSGVQARGHPRRGETARAERVARERTRIADVLPPEEEETPKDGVAREATRARPQSVTTVLRPGQRPQSWLGGAPTVARPDRAKYATVAAGGAPGVNNSAAENTCQPSTASAVLDWNVVADGADHWRADVVSLTLSGQINIKPWPSKPTSMEVPNTPNPVDGGNINNTTGSDNHWQAAIDDMANYNSAGGGAGPDWHSTAASSAHEWTHWNTDYVADAVNSAAGGNWPQANRDIDALKVPKASHADEASAKTALQPQVSARLGTWRSGTISRWNAIPDTAGVAGSTGYEAGMKVLDGHIDAIRAYATSKGWTGEKAADTSSKGMSRGAKVGLGILGGALVGAGIGAIGGPIGAGIGAGVGALIGGLIGGFA